MRPVRGYARVAGKGYKKGRFSFNVTGGRCEACQGAGSRTIEMHVLPSVEVRCEICEGKRFNLDTLDIRYGGKTIADVLAMTVADAREFFKNPKLHRIFSTMVDVGAWLYSPGPAIDDALWR